MTSGGGTPISGCWRRMGQFRRPKRFSSSKAMARAMRHAAAPVLLAQNAIVSRKILDEGWKVGYMERTETDRDGDSGWFFASAPRSRAIWTTITICTCAGGDCMAAV